MPQTSAPGRRRVPLALTAAVGAAAVFALVLLVISARRGRRGGVGVVERTTRRSRNLHLAGLGTSAGGRYAVHRARRVFASAARRDELDRRFEMRTAEQVTATLGHMKGALMKLGQMASYLDQGLPEATRDALAQLQQDAPPMSPELAAEQVRGELGASPSELFAEWDPLPIASASIGQVHRAITREGRAVAVKVQYPGVDEAIRADLGNVDFLFTALGMLFPGMDPAPIIEELRERLLEELDYRVEACNQALFVDYYEGHPHVHVPRVIEEYSSRRVLTTELAEGARFQDVKAWPAEERDLAAETMYRFVFGSIYRMGAFNGDPHPGNYLFRPGGHVVFLDFGLVKHFEEEVPVFTEMIDAMVIDHDPARFRRIMEDAGLLKLGMPFSDAQVVDYFRHFYEFVFEDGVRTIGREYASESVRRYFDLSGPHAEVMRAANLPPGFVIVQRINLGLYAIFADMEASGNWRRLAEEIWPSVSAPPTTELGAAHAAWFAERHLGDGPVARPASSG